MIDIVTIPTALADSVKQEMYSTIVPWSYFSFTTDFYDRTTEEQKQIIDNLSLKYGPVNDTQRFTYVVYQLGTRDAIPYDNARNNPHSLHRNKFLALSQLIDYFEFMYKPENHVIERIFINMQTIRPQYSLNNIHPDLRCGGRTILYYIDDSDGDTYFFDDKECIRRVPPIKGTAAIYPANTYHAGSTPILNEIRTVLNMVFIPKDQIHNI